MFGSDTEAPAHPDVLAALAAVNRGRAASYGGDNVCAAVTKQLKSIFETDLDALFVTSGTAANALALSILCPPTGAILCHPEAHIQCDERGAPEFFTGGGKLQLLSGPGAKIDADVLAKALAKRAPDFVHETPAAALSVTNLTELGRAYTPAELTLLSETAKAHGLFVHLDGARLANALVSPVNQGASPADLTWRSGVDVLTLGLTKTGAMACEIVIVFNPARERAGDLAARAKRAGHMPAKQRYIAAQAQALLIGDLWLTLANHANAAARSLAEKMGECPGIGLRAPVDGNEVFLDMPNAGAAALRGAGASFYPWPSGGYRFVCSWDTSHSELNQASRAVRAALATPA